MGLYVAGNFRLTYPDIELPFIKKYFDRATTRSYSLPTRV